MKKKFFHYLALLIMLFSFSIQKAFSEKNLNSISNDLNELMNFMCAKDEFSGAVLIAIHHKIVFKKACGLANRSFLVKNKIDTKFNLGSVGKLFTSVAIAQLVQQNKLSLTTPIENIISHWLPN